MYFFTIHTHISPSLRETYKFPFIQYGHLPPWNTKDGRRFVRSAELENVASVENTFSIQQVIDVFRSAGKNQLYCLLLTIEMTLIFHLPLRDASLFLHFLIPIDTPL